MSEAANGASTYGNRFGAMSGRYWERPALLIVGLFLGLVYFVSLRSPSIGLFHDDGVYAVTARALAEGRGYRLISLPHAIPETVYPFAFPAALSIVWRLWPSFPDNAMALKAVPLLCAVAWFILTWKLLRSIGAGAVQARWTVLLTAASSVVILLSTNLMSEPMFGALFMGTLLAVTRTEKSKSDRMAWIAGILAALAFLTRTIGLSLLVAVPLSLILQRRSGALWRFLAASIPIASIWPLWLSQQSAVKDPILSYYSSAAYNSLNILTNYSIKEKCEILVNNVHIALLSPAQILDLPSSDWAALFFMIFMLGVLTVAITRKFFRLDSVHLTIVIYVAICLCWAWPNARFIVVILPLVLFMIYETLSRLGLRRMAVILGGAAFCCALSSDFRSLTTDIHGGELRFAENDWSELNGMLTWLNSNAPQNSVTLADLDPSVFLYTGRKAMRSSVQDPWKLFYAAGAPTADAAGSLAAMISGTSADFLLVRPDEAYGLMGRNVEAFRAAHPGVLDRAAGSGSNSGYTIYRIGRSGTVRNISVSLR